MESPRAGGSDCAGPPPCEVGFNSIFFAVIAEKSDLRFRCVPPIFLSENSMSDITFSLEQILDSVNEMRAELRECIEPGSEITIIEELGNNSWDVPEERWFDDCEYDPR